MRIRRVNFVGLPTQADCQTESLLSVLIRLFVTKTEQICGIPGVMSGAWIVDNRAKDNSGRISNADCLRRTRECVGKPTKMLIFLAVSRNGMV